MLKLENITKYYYSSSSVTCALRKVNLEFEIGEFVAITGESGSGKTTLLNVISGLESYEDGEMYFDNKKTSFFDDNDWELHRKDKISFIFQNYNLIDSYTVLENVMAAFIIDGISYKEAKNKSKELLKVVGLEKDGHKKAIKLSGGQKQRLSIARALAKDTDIIVADEPTGNLDVENGKAVLELLKKVSKDKLVIVVTHNFGQVEQFITRKIRLHDGEVVLDEILHPLEKVTIKNKNHKEHNKLKQISDFAFLNMKSQPNKSIWMILLMFVAVLSSFTFVINFKANLDEDTTRYLEDDFFINHDNTRIIVKNKDTSIVSQSDYENAMVDHVVSYEKYDYITDINYFRPEDYKNHVSGGYQDMGQEGPGEYVEKSYDELKNFDRFLRSASFLTQDMLSYGRLPTNDYEMVIYDNNDEKLDTIEKVYFLNSKKWGIDSYYCYNVKIVGILKEKTKQAYFSDLLCRILDFSQHNINFGIEYLTSGRYSYQKSLLSSRVVVDDRLKGNEVCLSETQLYRYFSNIAITDKDNGFITTNGVKTTYKFEIRPDITMKITDLAIGVSKEFFESIYQSLDKKTQFAIFISDYAYTDDVLRDLNKADMDALSCFRASLSDFDPNKVIIRYVNLAVSIVALLVMNSLVVLLGFTILRIKKNDYVIFKMIGLTNSLCLKINRLELLVYSIIANVLSLVTTMVVMKNTNITLLNDLFKFVRFYDYFIVLLISLLVAWFISVRFSKFLTKKIKATVLKED